MYSLFIQVPPSLALVGGHSNDALQFQGVAPPKNSSWQWPKARVSKRSESAFSHTPRVHPDWHPRTNLGIVFSTTMCGSAYLVSPNSVLRSIYKQALGLSLKFLRRGLTRSTTLRSTNTVLRTVGFHWLWIAGIFDRKIPKFTLLVWEYRSTSQCNVKLSR